MTMPPRAPDRTPARVALAVIATATVLTVSISIATAQPAAPDAAASQAAAPSQTSAPTTASEETGRIAWYGRKFAGRRTASGERYDPDAMTMAHKTLPFGTTVQVTNPANGRKVRLRVNDRGPTQADRIGDVSLAAARSLGMVRAGVIDATISVVAEPDPKRR